MGKTHRFRGTGDVGPGEHHFHPVLQIGADEAAVAALMEALEPTLSEAPYHRENVICLSTLVNGGCECVVDTRGWLPAPGALPVREFRGRASAPVSASSKIGSTPFDLPQFSVDLTGSQATCCGWRVLHQTAT